MSTPPIGLLVVDYATVARAGVRACLETDDEPTIKVLGEAADAQSALIRTRLLQPQVVLAEDELPGADGVELAAALRNEGPAPRIVFHSRFVDEERVRELLQAGGSGFVHKGASASELRRAIVEVSRGRPYVEPVLAGQLFSVPPTNGDDLTDRQKDVLVLSALGYTSTEIGTILDVSHRTVETHRMHIKQRLSLERRADLMSYVLENDLIEPNAVPELDLLSSGELSVLKLTALGYSANETAKRLSLSPRTVEQYRADALRKLKLRDRVELVHFALHADLLRAWHAETRAEEAAAPGRAGGV